MAKLLFSLLQLLSVETIAKLTNEKTKSNKFDHTTESKVTVISKVAKKKFEEFWKQLIGNLSSIGMKPFPWVYK